MGKHRINPNYRRRVLRLPDLDHSKLAVLNSCAPGETRTRNRESPPRESG
jgi:hypothetical protein